MEGPSGLVVHVSVGTPDRQLVGLNHSVESFNMHFYSLQYRLIPRKRLLYPDMTEKRNIGLDLKCKTNKQTNL